MKKTLFSLFVLAGLSATAQVKVGNNPTNLATNAKFQVEGSTGAQTVILDNGNVGLGTTAPADKLHIYGNNSKLIIDNGTNATSEIGIVFKNGDGSSSQPKSAIISKGYNSWKRANMHFVLDGASDDGPYDLNTDTKMFIAAESGNVGIGTTNPSSKLEVNGRISNKGNGGYAALTQGGSAYTGYIEFYKKDGATRSGYIGYDSTDLTYVKENGGLHHFKNALRINDGSQGPGKILMSDINGVATWTNNNLHPDLVVSGPTAPAQFIPYKPDNVTRTLFTIPSTTFGKQKAYVVVTGGKESCYASTLNSLRFVVDWNNIYIQQELGGLFGTSGNGTNTVVLKTCYCDITMTVTDGVFTVSFNGDCWITDNNVGSLQYKVMYYE